MGLTPNGFLLETRGGGINDVDSVKGEYLLISRAAVSRSIISAALDTPSRFVRN